MKTENQAPSNAFLQREEKLPPHALEAEEAVIGCCLLDANFALATVIEMLGASPQELVDEGAFYDLRHTRVFEVCCELQDAGSPVDLITVQDRLRSKNALEAVGGLTYLSAVMDRAPSVHNIEHYAEIVRDKWRLRRMYRSLATNARRIWEPEGEDATRKADELLDQIEGEVLGANVKRGKTGGGEHIKPVLVRCVERMEHYARGVGMMAGLRTKLGYLDKMLGGLHPELIILAARPSAGKTSLAMNIAEEVGVNQKTPVGIFSLEMGSEDLVMRMMCARARANFHKIRTGFGDERDLTRIAERVHEISASSIHIDDTAGLDIAELRSRARRMALVHKVKLIVVDYLQLLHARSSSRPFGNRNDEISAISAGLKAMQKELGVPVLALSQLSRESEKGDRKPQLSDLRDSGAIEQDADCVLMLYRKKIKDPALREQIEESGRLPVNCLVAKQRNGPTGDAELIFVREQMRFEDAYQNRGTSEPRRRDQAAEVKGEQKGAKGTISAEDMF